MWSVVAEDVVRARREELRRAADEYRRAGPARTSRRATRSRLRNRVGSALVRVGTRILATERA